MLLSGLITRFISLKSFYLIAAGFGLVAAGWGGYQLAKAKYEAKIARDLRNTVAYYEKVQEENQAINSKLRDEIQSIRDSERASIEEVIKYVESNPEWADCKLDADGLQLWNNATKK